MSDKLTLLFPSDYFDRNRVDDDLRTEYEAAVETGLYDTILFSYEDWFNNGFITLNEKLDQWTAVIYRGWMMTPEQYEAFGSALYKEKIQLNTHDFYYKKMHAFPNILKKVYSPTLLDRMNKSEHSWWTSKNEDKETIEDILQWLNDDNLLDDVVAEETPFSDKEGECSEREAAKSIDKDEIGHILRVYTDSTVTIRKLNGETECGKLLGVDFDTQKLEYYALLFSEERAFRIYEDQIAEIIPTNRDKNASIINSVRTILSEKYLLWDNGVITDKSDALPVVNLTNEGVSIRVDYCNDLSAENVLFSEVFENPSVDVIVDSVEKNYEKCKSKKTKFGSIKKLLSLFSN